MSINNNNGAILVPPPPFTSVAVEQNTLPQTTSSAADNDLSPSLVITVLVLATAIIVSASIYLLLKFIRRRNRTSSSSQSTTSSITTTSTLPGHRNHHHHNGRVVPEQQNSITDSLPLFTYASLSSGNSNNNADCAVCLSKFEPEDRLRLLPVCCHAFHADCIDAWLITNQTCPLCRSSIFVSESDLLNKIGHTTTTITSSTPADTANRNSSAGRSGSFRVEIGSVSRRRLPPDFSGRSYSIGSFEYVLDDDVVVPESAVARRLEGEYVVEVDKQNQQISREVEVGERLAGEIGGGGGGSSSWLKDYVDRLAWAASVSLSSSLRSSGRFFGGSSRRTEVSRGIIHDTDLEASRQLGDEIGEMFRWLSGV